MAPIAKKSAPVAAASSATPVVSKKEPVVAAKSVAAPAPAVAKKEPVAAAAPATEVPAGGEAADIASPLVEIGTVLTSLVATIKELQAKVKAANKEYARLKKIVDKAEARKANARKNPSGFSKPVKISDEMCAFMSLPAGSQASRTDCTRALTKYVKEHNLAQADNKRVLVPDAKLRKLLAMKEGETTTYFQLQQRIKHHFVKA